jgi:hypothetical protein
MVVQGISIQDVFTGDVGEINDYKQKTKFNKFLDPTKFETLV